MIATLWSTIKDWYSIDNLFDFSWKRTPIGVVICLVAFYFSAKFADDEDGSEPETDGPEDVNE